MACATLKRSLELDPLQSPRPAKRPRCIPGSAPTLSAPHTFASWGSPFNEKYMNISRKQQHASRGDVQLHCSEEMRRLTRRRQLRFDSATAAQPDKETHKPDPKEKDIPLFTFEQVKLICGRMVREREEQLRELYEEALNAKLAEQYDAFVKFTHDHVQRHFETNSTPPSYLS